MNLGFFRELTNNIKENNIVQNFIKELGEAIEKTKNNKEIDSGEILQNIERNRKVSVVSRNKIIDQIDKISNETTDKQQILDKIEEISNEILDKQDEKLSEYRKEGHLYMVEEDVNDRIYLWDLTDKPAYSIEEVEFPINLKDKATEGAIFQYIDGQYIEKN